MARKTRSDIKIGTLEKKLGLDSGAIRNPDGTDARSDKKLGTLRSEFKSTKVNTPKKTTTATAKKTSSSNNQSMTPKKSATLSKVGSASIHTSVDQKKASIRVVKYNPKASSSVVRKVRVAIKKSVKK